MRRDTENDIKLWRLVAVVSAVAMVSILIMCSTAHAEAPQPALATLPRTTLVNGQECRVRAICPSLHPHKRKPRVATPVIAHDSMCWEFPLTIIREPVTIQPPELAPPPVTDDVAPPQLDTPPDEAPPALVDNGGGFWESAGATVGGWFTGGAGGYRGRPGVGGGGGMRIGAPEIDPTSATSALTILALSLTIVVRRK